MAYGQDLTYRECVDCRGTQPNNESVNRMIINS